MTSVKALKALAQGETVAFYARVLRLWEIGGLRMALVGDESGLTRVELGDAQAEAGRSYEFRDASIQQYPGGWTSVSIAAGGSLTPADDVPISQDEEYIERTFKILTGIQRKKGRRAGRLPAWKHPADGG
jgi:hypothetical protein